VAAIAFPRPGEFCRQALQALDASAGRSKRRKRDQTPDAIGMGIKRALLQRAADRDPAPEAFEGWLMLQIQADPASGATRAMCGEILAEYRLAATVPSFRAWLEAGAPSADTDDAQPVTPANPGGRGEALSQHPGEARS
jgi:hypothetical protein